MLPTVDITKVDNQTGGVRPGATGVLGIVAPSSGGTLNTPVTLVRKDLVLTEFNHGRLAELASYCFPVTKKPVVGVAGDPSTDGDYSAITSTGGGTSAATAGATAPIDEFDAVIEFPVGGTIGVAGIKYRYSLNGGKTFSKALALAVATAIVLPNSGITIELGAGTIIAGRKLAFTTTAPQLTNADIVASLEALRVTNIPFECVLIDMEADLDTINTCDLWLKALAAQKGRFKTIVLTARRRAADETEAEYRTALETMIDAAVSTDIVFCADLGDAPSAIRGFMQPRPTGLGIAARGMKIRLGVDAAYIGDGPIVGYKIDDARGNPKYHDESNNPGLDDLRITTLRSVEGYEGVYATNVKLLSAAGSDYVYWQHARVINRACEIAFQVLTKELSRGVNKHPTAGPDGERYIAEEDAARFEALVNDELARQLAGEVSDIKLVLSRTDDIRPQEGATISGAVQSVSLAYVKKFAIQAGYVNQIAADAAGA